MTAAGGADGSRRFIKSDLSHTHTHTQHTHTHTIVRRAGCTNASTSAAAMSGPTMLSPPGMSRPTSPALASPAGARKPVAAFRVLKKAVLKTDIGLDSTKCGSLKEGLQVDALEVQGNRVRTAHGWLSIVASSGTTLLERVGAAANEAAASATRAATGVPSVPAAQWSWELKKWERNGLHGEQTTKPFAADSSAKLEAAYRAHCAGGAGVIKLVLSGSEYKIDLRRMLQVNAKTSFERQLSRQGPEVPRTAAAPAAAASSAAQVPRSPLAAALAQRNAAAAAAGAGTAGTSPAARSPLQASQGGASPTAAQGQSGAAAAAPLPKITMYLNKGRSSTVWMCRLLNRGPQLGYFVETTFGRALPMAKCLGTDTTKAKVKPEGSRAASEADGKKMMRELGLAKMQRGYTKAPPPDVCPSKLPQFFEIGSEHKCEACGGQMQATERCEQLQCPAPGCEVYLSASEVAKKAALEEERRIARARERVEATAKARKFGTGFAQKRDGGELDQKAIKWFSWGLQHGDTSDVVLKQGLLAAQARVKIVKAMENMASTVDQDCKDVGLVREVLSDATPLVKAAMAGPVQHLPFSWLTGADAAEKRASANDRMKKGLKMLTRHAKNLQATLKREAAAKAAEEAKAARAAAAARLGISRCYKCNWPGRPGDTCPNCSSGSDVVALPAAPASEAGGKGVRRSSYGSASAGEMVCEYAKSNRSKCHGTGEFIPKDELRIVSHHTARSDSAHWTTLCTCAAHLRHLPRCLSEPISNRVRGCGYSFAFLSGRNGVLRQCWSRGAALVPCRLVLRVR